MDSLFAAGHPALVRRLAALTADTAPRWGKMNAARMLSHCRHPLRVALGEVEARPVAFGPRPFGRNYPTGPDFLRRGEHDFDEERGLRLATLRAFHDGGPAGIRGDRHPAFAPMTPADWDLLTSNPSTTTCGSSGCRSRVLRGLTPSRCAGVCDCARHRIERGRRLLRSSLKRALAVSV